MTGIYKKFKSGTDIRGIGIGNGDEPLYMSDEFISKASAAFADFLSEKTGKATDKLTVAIGHDPRLSAGRISAAVVRGLALRGVNIIDCSLSSTPAMFMAVLDLPCDGSVQMTASHHPGDRNGLKFFTVDGGLDSPDIAYILEKAEDIELGDAPIKITACDHMKQYAAHLRSLICKGIGADESDKPLAGMRIMVDAGNGAGGFYASEVLAPLGADVSPSMNLEPDGNFPVYVPNPESSVMIDSAAERVKQTNADFGIVFDTDVDRAGAVLPSDGGVIALDRNRLIALMAAILVRQYGPITVVTDSITSTGLTDFINSLGCRHHRFKRGYRNVINEAKRLLALEEAAKKAKEETDAEFANAILADAEFANAIFANAIFAMETSGHGALRENYFLDDGAYIIVKLLVALVEARREGKTLNELIANLKEPCESAEARLNVLLDDTADYTAAVLETVEKHFSNLPGFEIVQPNYEGVRVNADETHGNGWFLVRRSLHDPLMPCNIESNSVGGMRLIAAELYNALRAFDKLELEPLKKLM